MRTRNVRLVLVGVNLKAADGSIHKNYNGWVQNLDRGIRAELLRV
jgi:hypothetical protein